MASDITVQNHGSIVLLHLNSKAAREWVESKVSEEVQYFGRALVVEPRYVGDLLAGMSEDGLIVG